MQMNRLLIYLGAAISCLFLALVFRGNHVRKGPNFHYSDEIITHSMHEPKLKTEINDATENAISEAVASNGQTRPETESGRLEPQPASTNDIDFSVEHFKPDWTNAGFQTISSVIETYYWAMQQTNFTRWIECMTSREQNNWQLLSNGKTNFFMDKFASGLQRVVSYRIESITEFSEQEYLVSIKHAVTAERQPVVERFAVQWAGTRWRIAGESGRLRYPHHPADVSRFDSVQTQSGPQQFMPKE
jgi:hypothetical protein